MINFQPIVSLLSTALPAVLIAWIVGIPLGILLRWDRRIQQLLSPLLWIVLLTSVAMVPSFETDPQRISRLGQALLSAPLWLPLSLVVAALWERRHAGFALRTSLAISWLLSLGIAISGQPLSTPADGLALAPRWATWFGYGLVGWVLDRAIQSLVERLVEGDPDPESTQDRLTEPQWTWVVAGFALAVIVLEMIGRFGREPLLSQALANLVHGIGSTGARGREFMVLTRPAEWLGTVVGMAIALSTLLIVLRIRSAISPMRAPARVLRLLAGLVLYAGALSIALPAGLMAQLGPRWPSQLLVLLIPLLAYLIHMADQPRGAIARGGLLLAWVLVTGWMPLLGWSTIGDRMYIAAAFLDGEGLPAILLGQAVIATFFGGLLWLRRDIWLKAAGHSS